MTDKQAVAAEHAEALGAMARDVLDSNRYVVLGTAHPDGHPRVSPVFFGHHEHRALYWVSSPDSQHSRNLAVDDRVSAVVFDSTTPPPQNRGGRALRPAAGSEFSSVIRALSGRRSRPRAHVTARSPTPPTRSSCTPNATSRRPALGRDGRARPPSSMRIAGTAAHI